MIARVEYAPLRPYRAMEVTMATSVVPSRVAQNKERLSLGTDNHRNGGGVRCSTNT